MNNLTKWNNFIKEISNLIFFWFFGVVFFAIYRTSFIILYSKELGDNLGFSEFWNTYKMGFKFDCTATAYFLLIPLVCTLLLSAFNCFKIIKGVRIVCQYLFVIVSTLICLITLNYYQEYNEQFNNFVFLSIYDDQKAILKTIIDYYNPILNTLVLIATIVIGILIFKYFEKKTFIYSILVKIKPVLAKVILILAIIGLFVCCIRGSFEKLPAIRKWSAVTKDKFLNKTVINPYRSLKYAYDDYKELSQIGGENPYGDDLEERYTEQTVSDVIERKALGDTIQKPKQIFMVIMESYDSWPLLDKYSSFGISKNLSEIAKKGTHFTNFLPAYHATFYAYATVSTGIPYCGMNISRIATTYDPYVTSIFTQFKKLGYKTNMFYGGYLSWGNIGSFTEHIGCDRIYSGVDVGGKSESGDWGIEDGKLFDLVLDKVDPDEYTFNLILTSSYHAPYTVDIYNKGYTYKTIEDLPKEAQQYYDGGMNFLEMGHLWYGDWAIGQFMDTADKKYGEALYGFTGDHYGRRFLNHAPNLYETSSVPFILYGKDIPKQKLNTPGSHIDIMPTLIELVAPKDFTYYSFGTSMFEENKKMGVGFEKVIDRDSLFFSPRDSEVNVINVDNFEEAKTKTMKYQDDYNKLMKLSWHYVVRGDSLNIKEK